MAKKVRIEFNSDGFASILKAQKTFKEIYRISMLIEGAAGTDFESKISLSKRHGSARAVGIVAANSYKAMKAEATDKALTKAIGAGSG